MNDTLSPVLEVESWATRGSAYPARRSPRYRKEVLSMRPSAILIGSQVKQKRLYSVYNLHFFSTATIHGPAGNTWELLLLTLAEVSLIPNICGPGARKLASSRASFPEPCFVAWMNYMDVLCEISKLNPIDADIGSLK